MGIFAHQKYQSQLHAHSYAHFTLHLISLSLWAWQSSIIWSHVELGGYPHQPALPGKVVCPSGNVTGNGNQAGSISPLFVEGYFFVCFLRLVFLRLVLWFVVVVVYFGFLVFFAVIAVLAG